MSWLALIGAADAAILQVPQQWPTLADAVEHAVSGDVIELADGTWEADVTIREALTIQGVGAATLVGSLTVADVGSLDLRALELDAAGGAAVIAYADAADSVGLELSLTDVTVRRHAPSALAVDGAAVTLTRVVIEGGESALTAYRSTIALQDVAVRGAASGGFLLDLTDSSLVAEDLTLVENTALGLVAARGGPEVTAQRVIARCNSVIGEGLTLAADVVALGPLVYADNSRLVDDGSNTLVTIEAGSGTVDHAVIAGAGYETGIEGPGVVTVRSSIFASLGHAVGSDVVVGSYDLFDGVAVPLSLQDHAIEGAAALAPLTGVCDEPLVPGADSLAIDAGMPEERDRNGGPADIGPTGGPLAFVVDIDGDGAALDVDCDEYDFAVHPNADDPAGDGIDQDCSGADGAEPDPTGPTAPTAATDGDGDGVPAPLDCDDGDPRAFPGAEEDLGPADLDCDGYSDPADPFAPRGCAAAPGRAGALIALALALARPRRRA